MRGRQLRRDRLVAGDDGVGGDQGPRLAGEGLPDAVDHRPQRDDGRDADRDAQEEEQQAPPRRAHLADDHPQDEGHRPAPAATASSLTERPSRSTSRASATAATFRSCVTMTSVTFRVRRTCSSRSRMCRPLVLSRLPVGSSASTSGGSLASARAIATRCCSPPDSCDG